MMCYIFILIVLSQTTNTLAKEPSDIERTEREVDAFIPCPFGSFQSTPPVWRINGTDHTIATLPSIYSIDSSGIFINEVHKCMDQTSFQCVDLSDTSLKAQASNTGTLTVTTIDTDPACTSDELETFLKNSKRAIEIDHQHITYGPVNMTLAWKIIPELDNCTINQILSYVPCQHNNPIVNIETEDNRVTLSSDSLQFTGELIDFNISTLSEHSKAECPNLSETVRFNVNETETINLLLGNNNCTCVEMECQGGINIAISNPDPRQLDIVCPVYTMLAETCYSPEICNDFNDTPYFHICESLSESSGCKYDICFGNITEKLNNSRMDFYVSERVICDTTLSVYYSRRYIKSFEIKVAAASMDISINYTSGEICFSSSSQSCELTRLTRYNVSILDLSENEIFSGEDIAESTCVAINELMHPDHAPFVISAQAFNDYIEYNSVKQLITSAHTVLKFINDSPRINGSTITADIYFNQPVRKLRCALTGLPSQNSAEDGCRKAQTNYAFEEETLSDGGIVLELDQLCHANCASGSVTFSSVPPRCINNYCPYTLRVVGVSTNGVRRVIRRHVRPDTKGLCLVHFINDGVTVDGNNATVEFTGTGVFDTFVCNLDRKGFKPCSSPHVYEGLSTGHHRVKVVPNFHECGRRRRSLAFNFTIC